MGDLRVAPEELVTLKFRNNKIVRVTSHMYEALGLLRQALVDAARHGQTLTYGEASTAMNGAYLPVGMGPILDVLSVECERRGEPSLAALVVRKDTEDVGDAFIGDADSARKECYEYWDQRR